MCKIISPCNSSYSAIIFCNGCIYLFFSIGFFITCYLNDSMSKYNLSICISIGIVAIIFLIISIIEIYHKKKNYNILYETI